ncbi:hypothetical protein DPMN_010672 [Dreissena polymorpha]|uniref:Uncharacterized protein n=1 Tax=Dreissena polymorpha TaxID=45954 RepID=A0A9D4N2K6_DREPO|nr:hypothetical protein DPMN_010672 [Dreissena polymorpha]
MPIHGNTGVKVGIDVGGPVVTPDTRTFVPDPIREQACVELLKEILPRVCDCALFRKLSKRSFDIYLYSIQYFPTVTTGPAK